VRAGIGNDTAAIFVERDPGDADRTLGAHVAQGVAGGFRHGALRRTACAALAGVRQRTKWREHSGTRRQRRQLRVKPSRADHGPPRQDYPNNRTRWPAALGG
jgi:hypothetical protein